MNANQLTRIVDAIALERAGKPPHQVGDYWRNTQGEDQLSRTSSARADLRRGGIGVLEIGGRSGHPAIDPEGEAMKQRLIKHMLIAVAIVTVFLAFHVFSRM